MVNKIKAVTNEEMKELEKTGYVQDFVPIAELKIQELKEDSVILVEANHQKIALDQFKTI